MVGDIRELGFNGLNIEAKPWEEFFDFYRDRKSGFYIDAVQRTLEACRRHGLRHSWMGFWILGENLDILGISPLKIRQGELSELPARLKEGDRLGHRIYKTWAPDAVKILAEHHAGLTDCFEGQPVSLVPGGNEPLVTGCEFTVFPSFDEEGRARYRTWLARHYGHDIASFNKRYQTAYANFNAIEPADYWANFHRERGHERPWRHWHPDASEFLAEELLMRRWVDNQLWRMEESENFARDLTAAHAAAGTKASFWMWCNQWKQFLQDKAGAWWWHCDKACDPWRMRYHLPEVSFITSPSDCEHRSSAAALSLELAIVRSINGFGPFHGGIFLGSHLLGDVYDRVTPGEAIAGCLAAGATRGILSYGYNGLDDGGCLAQMPWDFRASVSAGIAWFRDVQPRLGGCRQKQIAVLFPMATMVLEPVDTLEPARQPNALAAHRLAPASRPDPKVDFMGHRQDVLGWYQALCDAQYAVDFLHPDQIKAGSLKDFTALLLPWCPAHRLWPEDTDVDKAIVQWLRAGGTLLCGPDEAMLPVTLTTGKTTHPPGILDASEPVVAEGPEVVAYPGLSPVVTYRTGGVAIGRSPEGSGQVIRFGFHLGWAYGNPSVDTVAVDGHDALFPVHTLRHSFLGHVLQSVGIEPLLHDWGEPDWRGVEVVRYPQGWIAVNHSRHLWPWPESWRQAPRITLFGEVRAEGLGPHDAAWIEMPVERFRNS